MHVLKHFNVPLALSKAKIQLALSTFVAILAVFLTGLAHADYGVVLVTDASANIEVETDGSQYTHIIDPVAVIDATIYTELSSGPWGKVKSP